MNDGQTIEIFNKAGSPPAYMDQPEFAAFWEADSKRVEAAIDSIGKVEG